MPDYIGQDNTEIISWKCTCKSIWRLGRSNNCRVKETHRLKASVCFLPKQCSQDGCSYNDNSKIEWTAERRMHGLFSPSQPRAWTLRHYKERQPKLHTIEIWILFTCSSATIVLSTKSSWPSSSKYCLKPRALKCWSPKISFAGLGFPWTNSRMMSLKTYKLQKVCQFYCNTYLYLFVCVLLFPIQVQHTLGSTKKRWKNCTSS